jgi:hypothetical protein
MIEEILKKIKAKFNIEYAEHHFEESVMLPFIIYFSSEKFLYADCKAYLRSQKNHLELYTDCKEEEIEGYIEELLSNTTFTKESEYINDENMFVTIYKFEEI